MEDEEETTTLIPGKGVESDKMEEEAGEPKVQVASLKQEVKNVVAKMVTNLWRHDIQHNDTQLNDTQYNYIQHNYTQHNDTQHNYTQHNDPQHKRLICSTQHK